MKFNLEKTEALTAALEMTLEKSDYEQDYLNELNDYRKKASVKGFRKGKTPLSFVKKMYGKSVLAEQVNKKLQSGLFDYLKKESIDILGDPLPSADQEEINFNENALEDYTFKFDLGISPELDLKGVAKTDKYNQHRIKITDDLIDDEIKNYRKQLGGMEITESPIEGNDVVKLQVEELDGSKVKKDGWATEFSVSVDLMEASYSKDILGLKNGDTIDFDIYKIEKDKDEAYVKKYLIQNEEENLEVGNMFRGTVGEIKRLELAEMDQAFYDKLFGKDEIASEEALRTKIEENIQSFYNKQCDSLMYRDMMEALVEQNKVDLPDAFLKRWLTETNKEHTEEQIVADFPKFKENLIWTLIKNKLSAKFDVKVDPDEIKQQMAVRVQSYFGGNMPPDQAYFGQIVEQMLQDKQQVQTIYTEIEADKIFKALENDVELVENKISLDDYKALVEKANKQYNK